MSEAIRIILIGKTGSRKSSFGNSLLNQNLLKVGRGMRSVTAKYEWRTGKRSGTLIEEQMKGGYFHTTFFEKLLLRKLQVSHRKIFRPLTKHIFRTFAELSINRPLLFIKLLIMLLMIPGCSTNPLPQASCTARHCVVGEPTAVTCLFGKTISASRLGVNVQMFPFNAPSNIAGKDVLMCSRKKNTTTCFVAEGYSFNYNISDRLTLEIPVATPEIAGVYMCHVASEDSPPRACNLTVTEGSESTSIPTTTHATTGKETSNTTEPRRTLALGTGMIVVLIFLVTLTGLECLLIVTVLKLYKRIKPITQNREAEDKETLLATKRNASANDKKYTKTDL